MTLRITEPMLSGEDTEAQVALRYGEREVDDGAARTIAGWWASSGHTGHVLAALSTGCEVDLTDLLADIRRTRATAGPHEGTALDMLATWAINRERQS